MRVLLDENVDRRLKGSFDPEFEVRTVVEQGWRGMTNGELLRTAQKDFDAFVTTDRGIPHQQNLGGISLRVVFLLRARTNRYEDTAPLLEEAQAELQRAQPGALIRVPREEADP
jgi:predicted nuclease of predicted toxin-antitoxin system